MEFLIENRKIIFVGIRLKILDLNYLRLKEQVLVQTRTTVLCLLKFTYKILYLYFLNNKKIKIKILSKVK